MHVIGKLDRPVGAENGFSVRQGAAQQDLRFIRFRQPVSAKAKRRDKLRSSTGKNHDKKSANDGSNSHFGPQDLHSRRYLEPDCAQCQGEFFRGGGRGRKGTPRTWVTL